jgi:hypothetical protein
VALVLLVVVVVGAVGLVLARRSEPSQGDLVILYGDSLSWESAGPFTQALERRPDTEVLVRGVPGAAICDLADQMRSDLDEHDNLSAVVIEFVGNNATRCVAGLTGPALADRYADDARTVTDLFVDRGIPVVWAGVPEAPGLPGGASILLDADYHVLVDGASGPVWYAPAGAAVTGPNGEFVTDLDCLPDEGVDQGCVDGRITVRSPDRIHFCPTAGNAPCPVYSSGARRFGEAMAAGAIQSLDGRH